MAIKGRRGKLYPPVDQAYAEAVGIDEIEWERIVDRLGRPPNHFECSIFASLWSEEVSNKSSSSLLDTIRREQPDVINVPGSQVGLVEVGDGQYLALRIVHNNHQTQLEPNYGAQTAIDQSLEELATVGARPLGIMTLLRFGAHDLVKNQRLFQGVVEGIGGYGNRFGSPIIGGELYFHKRYNKGLVVNSGAIGLVNNDHAFHQVEVPFRSPVLYVGSPTGRDGLPTQDVEQEDLIRASKTAEKLIKISDPLLANRMISACAEAVEAGVLQEIVAVGAGGLAVATFDMARRVNRPILLDIDRIPLRGRQELKPLETILSESSERLLVVTRREHHRPLTQIFHKWDLTSVKVGEVNDADGIEFYWNHYIAADIPFQFAIGGAVEKTIEVVKFPPMLKRRDGSTDQADQIRKRKRKVEDEWSLVREVALAQEMDDDKEIECPKNLEDVWLDLLADPNLCSRKAMYELFDQVVGANTVVRPGGDAAVLRLRADKDSDRSEQEEQGEDPDQGPHMSHRGLAFTLDSNSLYVSMEPYLGTVQTIAEGMRNLAATGARPVALAHCLNFGHAENYKEISDLSEAIRGLGDASHIWKIPILSENVSLGNGTDGTPTLPTPAVLMAGLIKDVRNVCTVGFRRRGDVILLLGLTKNEIGCSEYANYTHKRVNRLVPDIDFDVEKKVCSLVVDLIDDQLLCSAHDLSGGGLAVALTESCMAGRKPIGARFTVDPQVFETPNGPVPLRRDAALFSESSGRFLISCDSAKEEEIRNRCAEQDIPITGRGEVGGKMVAIDGAVEVELPISTTYRLWMHRMEHLLGHREREDELN